jgi:hypothetical protein
MHPTVPSSTRVTLVVIDRNRCRHASERLVAFAGMRNMTAQSSEELAKSHHLQRIRRPLSALC